MGIAKRRPLTLSEDDEYRVQREWGKVKVQRKMHSLLGGEPVTWWRTLTYLDRYNKYTFADRSRKLAINKEYREKGERWIARYLLLLASNMWEVQCNNWDGQGTPCPLQRERDNIPGCPYHFFYLGYAGGGSYWQPLPGKCIGPLNHQYHIYVCVPTTKDKHGFSMNHLARIRAEIWKREKEQTNGK